MSLSSNDLVVRPVKSGASFLFSLLCYILVFFPAASVVFAAEKTEYVLRPGDIIAIRVVEHDEFSQKCRIRPDGMVNYPVVGEIEVGGLTTQQLVKIMEEKLAPYVNNVVVSVAIEQYFSNRVFVIGAVGRSGEIEIFEPTDVLKILAMAGGLQNPKTRYLKVIRSNGDIVQVDLATFMQKKGSNQEETFLLYPGDTMFVPEKFSIPWALLSTIVSVVSASISLTLLIINLGG